MALIKKGSTVLIVKGADAGKKAEVLNIEGTMLKIKVENGKERKISFRHVEPLKP